MAINPHHIVDEIKGIRCSVIEKNIDQARADFITKILTHNGLEVISSSNEENKITIGVSNITFNLVHALYARQLKNTDGKILTPSIWYHQKETSGFYWEY